MTDDLRVTNRKLIRKNITANFIARGWGFVSSYLFIPLYLKFLGIEAYGLVGFYSTLLGVFAFADMGFTATINREMARLSVRKGSSNEMRDLLRTYELAYLCISFVLAVVIWTIAPLIAERWLHSKVLQPYEIAMAVRLMGVSIAFQLPSGLYISGLMGLQRQVWVNSIQVAWGAFRGIGAVLVLWLFSPTIFAFALWQLISNSIYCFIVYLSLWHILSPHAIQSRPRFKWQIFRGTWRYMSSMAGMAVIYTILAQTDKLTVSKMLSLEMVGYYTLAGALAYIPLMMVNPVASAVFPRFSGLVEVGDSMGLTRLCIRTSELAAIAVIPTGITLALFAGNFIFAWTGSTTTASQAGLVAGLLLCGQLIQAIGIIPYYVVLAHGNVKYYLYLGLCSVVLITPILIFMILKYGIVGAGVSWFILGLCSFPFSVYFVSKYFLPGEIIQWLYRGVGRPLFVALTCALIGKLFVPHTDSRFVVLCFIGSVWFISTTTTAISVPEVRYILKNRTYKLFG